MLINGQLSLEAIKWWFAQFHSIRGYTATAFFVLVQPVRDRSLYRKHSGFHFHSPCRKKKRLIALDNITA